MYNTSIYKYSHKYMYVWAANTDTLQLQYKYNYSYNYNYNYTYWTIKELRAYEYELPGNCSQNWQSKKNASYLLPTDRTDRT